MRSGLQPEDQTRPAHITRRPYREQPRVLHRALVRRRLMQFECGTRILRVVHGRDARATSALSFRVMTMALPKELTSEFEFHQLCDELESGQLDGVNLQSVPADEAQRISYQFWWLKACRPPQEKT